jgi:hypothetical protein
MKPGNLATLSTFLRKIMQAMAIDIRAELETRKVETLLLKPRDTTDLSAPLGELSPEVLAAFEKVTGLSKSGVEALPTAALARLEAQAEHRQGGA